MHREASLAAFDPIIRDVIVSLFNRGSRAEVKIFVMMLNVKNIHSRFQYWIRLPFSFTLTPGAI